MAELTTEQQAKIYQKRVSNLFKEIKTIHSAAQAVNSDPSVFPHFRGRYKALDKLYNDYIVAWDKLYELYVIMNKEGEFPIEEKFLTLARTFVYECNEIYDTTMFPVPKPDPPPTSLLNATIAHDVSMGSMVRHRLPKIHLPRFEGELREWPHFRDIFTSLVHEESSLSPIEKFHHLVGSLKGEPLRLVSTFPLSSINYDNAWTALIERYDNKRILASAYLHRIQEFNPSVKSSSSSSYLRAYLKIVADSFTAFNSLKIPNEADYLKLHLALDCLDTDNRKLFEESQHDQSFPTYDSLIEFIQRRCKILELSETSHPPRAYRQSNSLSKGSKVLTTFAEKGGSSTKVESMSPKHHNCPKCRKDHLLFRCFAFKSLSYDKKMNFIQNNQICINCLREGHTLATCTSSFTCFHCHKRHHSLLHRSPASEIESDVQRGPAHLSRQHQPPSTEQSETASAIVTTTMGVNNVLLGTAMVNIADWEGNLHPIRILVDSGSQFSIISELCVQKLGLVWKPSKRKLCGVGLTRLPSAKGILNCTLFPMQSRTESIKAQPLVMSSLTFNMPTVSLSPSVVYAFESVNLADERFWESRPVDFLLGSDLFPQIITSEPLIKISEKLCTVPTIFGHIVVGVPPSQETVVLESCLSVIEPTVSDETLKNFWEIEEVPTINLPFPKGGPENHPHPENIKCEEYFRSTVKRQEDGRYVVSLPLRDPTKVYPESHALAMARFRGLELKLLKQPTIREQYNEFIREYLELNHMEETSTIASYVTPHHAVFKGSGNEQKIRVVFDASMSTRIGSLNENLFIGPKLQKDLSLIIMNFRTHKVALCADIVKMFRQILVASEHRTYQHILWRFSPEDAIKTYELNTLTYGQSSSPYLAQRVLMQLVEDEGDNFLEASRVLMNDVYVDDIITGANTVQEAIKLKAQIIGLLKKGCFPVHRWASNSTELMDTIPTEEELVCLQSQDSTFKVLGIHWDVRTDCFRYKVELSPGKITKRSMLSTIARLFDPLGFLAPVILMAKYMVQCLWSEKLDWDDSPPPAISENWVNYLRDLPSVSEILIPRWICSTEGKLRLFGFCDASEKGYAATIYLQVVLPSFDTQTFLITSKTRLAPLKTISIPRLELCSAHLLTKVLRSLTEFCQLNNIEEVLLFTDSTIVLSWLQISPHRLKTFVSNRVGYILTHTKLQQWHYVPSKQNPADIASRGIRPTLLSNCELWWKGPQWINVQPLVLPTTPEAVGNLPDCKLITFTMATTNSSSTFAAYLIHSASQFEPLVRKMAYIFRFVNNVRNTKGRNTGILSVTELEDAISYLIRETQMEFFQEDFDFKEKRSISSRFKCLAVFQDESLVLRVGGRLSNASLSYDKKHPILLHSKAPLSVLLVDHIHQSYFHLGPKALQAYIQRKYYIHGIRSLVRLRVWKCLRCFKLRAKPHSPFMANLPISRVSQGRPFISVGIDFAGPYNIKQGTRRNAPTTKAYLCLFVCMAVKAVHLELVSDLSTKAFLAAFDRFIARRGLPSEVRSDCGTNFVGAARELKELYAWHNSKETHQIIGKHTSNLGIQWHFNPPSAPHFGGLWEAAVKSAKIHLKKTIGDRSFHFEELATIFTRIESILNSRPLCTMTSNPDDFDYLSPGHFLIGSALIAPPEQDISEINMGRQTRWQLLQSSVQVFWKRWATEYVHLLQARRKWTTAAPSITIDDLVLLQEPNTSPLHWKLGRITELHPGQDGIVRVVSVKTANGTLRRAVHKLAPLSPINEDRKKN